MNTTRRRKQLAAATMRWYRRRAAKFIAQGLTTWGRPRKYRKHSFLVWTERDGGRFVQAHGRRRDVMKTRLYRSQRRQVGLTARGTPRIDHRTPLERQWQHERAQMVVEVRSWEDL